MADSAGLLSRCTGIPRTAGSNPALSATFAPGGCAGLRRQALAKRAQPAQPLEIVRAPLVPPRLPTRLALALATAALASCQAERALRITSEPSQAEVRLDGSRVGTTPCEVPFEHYGVRRLTLYLPGYATYSRVLEIEPPWYGEFPVDIFTEVLVPIGWSDIQKVHVRLVKGQSVLLEPDLPSVIERADNLRHAGPAGPKSPAKSEDEDRQP